MPAASYSTPKIDPPSTIALGSGILRRVFSFPVMCMSLLTAVIFAYAPRGLSLGEPDIWWRLRNGSYFLQHHSILRADIYSLTAQGSPWTSFEWLSDVSFFLAFKAGGLQGILAVYAMATVLIFAGVYYRSCRAGADCKDAAVATLAGIFLGSVSLAPRPTLFGWLFLIALLLVLDHFKKTGEGLWILPPLFLVWINFHGSWIYGMVILFLTIVSGLVEGQWGLVTASRWSPAQLKKLLLTFVASVAAILVNPFGYKLVLYPFLFQLHFQSVMQFSEYWRPVDFSTWNGKLALGLIFALLAAALFSRSRWRLDDVLLAAFALWSGLSHLRFLDFTAIVIVPILAPHLKLFPPYEQELDKPWLNAAIISAVVASIIFSFPSAVQLQDRLDNEYPVAALAFMQRLQNNARIFHQHEFGGYIEWKAPELRTFIDGRDEIFVAKGVFDDYLSTIRIERPLEILDKYGIRYVLLEPGQPLGYLLEHSTGWRLIYTDRVAVIFERVSMK